MAPTLVSSPLFISSHTWNSLSSTDSLQDSLWHKLHGLPDTQIPQHLLGTAQDGIKLVRPVEVLNDAPHARLRQPAAAPDLHGLVGDLVRGARARHLEQRDGPAQVLGLLTVGHVAHLEGDGLEPRLVRLAEGNHLGELLADDGLVNQPLAEDEALMRPLEGFFDDEAHVPDCGAWGGG